MLIMIQVCWPLLVVATTLSLACSHKEQPDADIMLKGVQSRRESLPECSFDLEIRAAGAMVGYDGMTFRVNYSEGKFVYVRDEDHATMSRDGEMIYYNPNSCVIKVPKDSGVGFLYDPRLFGLSIVYYPSLQLDVALRNSHRTAIEIEGREDVRNNPCWKIRVDDEWGEVKFYWVNPSAEFRVMKIEHHIGEAIGTTVNYYENSRFDFLPSKIVSSRDRNPEYQIEFEIKNVDLSPEQCSFDFSSLGMKAGTPITDIRIHERVGYWDGSDVVDWASSSKTSDETSNQAGSPFFWVIAIFGVVAIFATAAYLKRKTRQ